MDGLFLASQRGSETTSFPGDGKKRDPGNEVRSETQKFSMKQDDEGQIPLIAVISGFNT